MTARIRTMLEADLPAVADLSSQLGYPVTAADIAERFGEISRRPDHLLLVAEADGSVVGWAHAHGSRLLVAPASAELGGLIVREGHRGRGVGTALMQAVESWAAERGCARVRVRSNVVREEAHRFYEGIGYRTTKTSRVFEKPLSGQG